MFPKLLITFIANGATTRISIPSNVNFLCNPYPGSLDWTNCSLATNSPVGAKLHLLDETDQVVRSYWRTRSSWQPAGPLVIESGRGFFYSSSISQDWVVIKPYSWP